MEPIESDVAMTASASASAAGESRPASPTGNSPAPAWAKWAVGFLLAAHAAAVCAALPVTAVGPATTFVQWDYPVHTRRAEVCRAAWYADGCLWGYDPRVNAGMLMQPAQEVGSVPYQFLALLLPQARPGHIVAAYAWATLLAFPWCLLLTTRLLRYTWDETVWALALGEGVLWLIPPQPSMIWAGMMAFLSACFWVPVVVALYARFFRGPSLAGYAAAVSAGALLFGLHPYGPVAILPALAALVLFSPAVGWPWRVAALCSPLPIALLNAPWLLPVVRSLRMPPPPWRSALQLEHRYWNWADWSDFQHALGPVVLAVLALLTGIALLTLPRLARRCGRTAAVACGLVVLTTLLLFLFGSFWSPTRVLQPVRFATPFWIALALLGGLACGAVGERLRLPPWIRAVLWGVAAFGLGIAVYLVGPRVRNEPDVAALMQFLQQRTTIADRVLMETTGFAQALPGIIDREVIANAFPDDQDPVQFLPDRLFGRRLEEWSLPELRAALDRFAVNWVLADSAAGQRLFGQLSGDSGTVVGNFRAYAMGGTHDRFLTGTGEVRAGVNRLELTDVQAPEGFVVLRYRYHPGWVCDPPSALEPYPIPEGGGGLLLIRNPRPSMQVRFDTQRALHAAWPADPIDSAQPKPSAGH